MRNVFPFQVTLVAVAPPNPDSLAEKNPLPSSLIIQTELPMDSVVCDHDPAIENGFSDGSFLSSGILANFV